MEILQIVKDAITENPELTNDQLVEKLKASDSDAIFTTKTENNTHIANQVKNTVQDEVNNAIRNIHTKSEESISSLLGVQKPDGIKGYEWSANVIGEQKTQLEKLQDQINSKVTGDELSQQQVKELREQIEGLNGQLNQKDLDNSLFQKDNSLSTVFAALDIDKNIDQDLISLMVSTVKGDLVKNSEMKDGKLVFKKEDGSLLLNPSKGSEPYTAEEIVAERMQKYTTKEVLVKGVNGVPNTQGTTTADPVSNFIASKAPQTKGDVIEAATEYYKDKGISNVSKTFITAVTEANTKYKLD